MEEVNKTDRKKHILIWVVVGIVVLAVILVPILLSKKANTETVITLESVNTELQTIKTRVGDAELKVAEQAELIANVEGDLDDIQDTGITDYSGSIANINTRITTIESRLDTLKNDDIGDLVKELSDLSVNITAVWTKVNGIPDLSSNIADLEGFIGDLGDTLTTLVGKVTAIEGDIATIQEDITELRKAIPSYAVVTDISTGTLTVDVYGEGNYTVVLTLYSYLGNLVEEKISAPIGYAVDDMFYAQGKLLAVFITANTGWEEENTITLVTTGVGSISYASASLGVGG